MNDNASVKYSTKRNVKNEPSYVIHKTKITYAMQEQLKKIKNGD